MSTRRLSEAAFETVIEEHLHANGYDDRAGASDRWSNILGERESA